jgi:hypothetical protein
VVNSTDTPRKKEGKAGDVLRESQQCGEGGGIARSSWPTAPLLKTHASGPWPTHLSCNDPLKQLKYFQIRDRISLAMPAYIIQVSHLKFQRDDMFPAAMKSQKGPTCWYYAARLVREFHGKTYKWNPQMDDTEARKTEKAISDIRKSHTKIDDHFRQIKGASTAPAVGEAAGKLFDYLENLTRNDVNLQFRLFHLVPQLSGKVSDSHQTPKGEFVVEMRKAYQQMSLDQFSATLRTQLLNATLSLEEWGEVYGRYGFQSTKLADYNNLKALTQLLGNVGPMVAIGEYALNNYEGWDEHDMLAVSWFQNKVDFLYRDESEIGFLNGAHAVVICGTATLKGGLGMKDKEIVVYKDPNVPHKYFSFDLALFQKNQYSLLGTPKTNLYFLPCSTSGSCEHIMRSVVYS